MNITRKSPFTGAIHTLDLPVTEAQLEAYDRGALLQDAFPNLSAGDREFIKTGITNDEWNSMFGMSDDQEDEDIE